MSLTPVTSAGWGTGQPLKPSSGELLLQISSGYQDVSGYDDIRISGSENISTEKLSISMMNDAEWASIALGLQAEYSMNNCFGIFKMNLNSFPTIHMHAWKGLAD